MTESFLRAVTERLASTNVWRTAELTADSVLLVLVHLDLPSRLRAAAVNRSFLEASHRPELYAIIGKPVLSRRTSEHALLEFAKRLLGPSTRELNLANMRALNEEEDDLNHARLSEVLLTVPDGPRMVPRMPNLESLDLSATELNDNAMTVVAAAYGPSLKRLYLWAAEGIGDAGILTLAQQTQHLRADVLATSALEVVDLRMCGGVTGFGIRGLAKGCPRLTDLRLKGLRRIDDDTFAALGAHCPLLTSLDASVGSGGKPLTGVSDRGVAALAAGCPRLEQLQLSGNSRVSDAGVAALAEGCAALRLLDLQGCSTCGDGAARALVAHCRSLEVVQCCAQLSDDGFVALCTRCPRLRHLTIKLCKVTQPAIDEMRAAHRSLVVVSVAADG